MEEEDEYEPTPEELEELEAAWYRKNFCAPVSMDSLGLSERDFF